MKAWFVVVIIACALTGFLPAPAQTQSTSRNAQITIHMNNAEMLLRLNKTEAALGEYRRAWSICSDDEMSGKIMGKIVALRQKERGNKKTASELKDEEESKITKANARAQEVQKTLNKARHSEALDAPKPLSPEEQTKARYLRLQQLKDAAKALVREQESLEMLRSMKRISHQEYLARTNILTQQRYALEDELEHLKASSGR
jgi:hypothetical protein